MKYKVLERCISPFNVQELCPGEVYDWDVTKYDGVTKIMFASMVQHGFIEEIKDGPWEPKPGQKFYYILEYGKVDTGIWFNDELSLQILDIGNFFQTKEEAEKAVEWLKAFKTLRDDAKGFKPDWSDPDQDKFSVFYDHTDKYFGTIEHCDTQAELIVFAAEADAKESIKAHPHEWKVFLGVEENNE